jgi:major intracellular serine protease
MQKISHNLDLRKNLLKNSSLPLLKRLRYLCIFAGGFMRFFSQTVLIFTILGFFTQCRVAKDAINIFCTSGHIKGKMTVGLSSAFYPSSADYPSDSELLTTVNDSLSGLGISTNLLNVKSVDSLQEGDKFRFLELGGQFAPGFGIAEKLLSETLGNQNPFGSMSESFSVRAAYVADPVEYNSKQWAMEQNQLDEALALLGSIRATENGARNDNEPIIVAVLDTGVDPNHPDLQGILLEGQDFTGEGIGSADENGHGTHCAGIVAATKTAAEGPLGVAAPINVKILPIKVLGKKGGGGFQAIEKGIRYAMMQNVDVISMSLGAGLEFSDINSKSNPLSNALIKEAIDAGILVIVAAGNEACELGGKCRHDTGLFPKSYNNYTVLPCANEGVICVGATSADETLASYSNYKASGTSSEFRTQPDINAPGTNIYSTWPTNLGKNYNTISGTSMATPFVAGMAALFKWADRTINQAKFKEFLNQGAALPDPVVEKAGSGRADLHASVKAFAYSKSLIEEAPSNPPQRVVEDPATEPGQNGDGLVSDLWGAVCQ